MERSTMIDLDESNRRLMVLVEFLRHKVKPERFDYTRWASRGFGPRKCGTTACAAGWATVIPEFRDMGLRLYEGTSACQMGIEFDGLIGLGALAKCFGLGVYEVVRLFSPTDEHDKPEPVDVAWKIEKFVQGRVKWMP